jgi:hypothetical protein
MLSATTVSRLVDAGFRTPAARNEVTSTAHRLQSAKIPPRKIKALTSLRQQLPEHCH